MVPAARVRLNVPQEPQWLRSPTGAEVLQACQVKGTAGRLSGRTTTLAPVAGGHGTVIDGSWPLTLEVQNRGVEPETPHLCPTGKEQNTELLQRNDCWGE